MAPSSIVELTYSYAALQEFSGLSGSLAGIPSALLKPNCPLFVRTGNGANL